MQDDSIVKMILNLFRLEVGYLQTNRKVNLCKWELVNNMKCYVNSINVDKDKQSMYKYLICEGLKSFSLIKISGLIENQVSVDVLEITMVEHKVI